MEVIESKLEQLFVNWKSQRDYEPFVDDGILNYQKWLVSNPKIMFLLKESADDFVKIRNFSVDITKGKGPHFWWNICYWKYLVNELYKGEDPMFISQDNLPEVLFNNNVLDSIAYVNVKKSCENLSVSSDQDILDFANRDKDFLGEQINLINPDVVFCSNVTFVAYKLLFKEDGELIKINQVCYRHKDRLILCYNHPSYFQIAGGRETLFNNLKKALLEGGNVLKQFSWGSK